MEKEFMVTEEELKKYQVFDKIEKKELSHYLLLEEAVEYIESHMTLDLTSKGKEVIANKLRDCSEFICTGETEEDWYQFVMKELGIPFVMEPKKNPNAKRVLVRDNEIMLFRQGLLKFPGDEDTDAPVNIVKKAVKISKEAIEEASLGRAKAKGITLTGNFTKIGKI